MDLSADTTINFPLDLVFAAYRDELTSLVEFMPNIRRIEVKSREEEGSRVRLVNEWHGGGEMPAAARVVLSESMLSWTDYADWDSDDHSCTWRIATHSFKDAVDCHGKNRFVAVGDTTRLEIRGQLGIDASKVRAVPKLLQKSVGKTIEDFLVKKITPNLLDVSAGLARYLEKRHG
ncbi:MAG: SRPBCC family protein [Sorangiineae bacterium]|nr:SRPBCC family protein [Polyangiaceae bacterium]MEB2322049.1 SRPBCC family protein [Sorangiineae bacterium]